MKNRTSLLQHDPKVFEDVEAFAKEYFKNDYISDPETTVAKAYDWLADFTLQRIKFYQSFSGVKSVEVSKMSLLESNYYFDSEIFDARKKDLV